jgi:hypothetical protein
MESISLTPSLLQFSILSRFSILVVLLNFKKSPFRNAKTVIEALDLKEAENPVTRIAVNVPNVNNFNFERV